jgi:hypothetical protein
MLNISVEKKIESVIQISPMSIKREWMDLTPEKHAYRCFPVTQANMIGWSLSCTEDIEFIWNGINDTSSENIRIISKKDFLYTGRGQSTLSIVTGLVFKTDENLSMFTINPVNNFNNDFEVVSSLISTSWLDTDFPIAIKAKSANKNILIKANTVIAQIIPISLTEMNNTSINIIDFSDPNNIRQKNIKSYGEESQKVNAKGEWTDWYRDAVNEKKETIGKHEAKVLKLYVKDNTKNIAGDII